MDDSLCQMRNIPVKWHHGHIDEDILTSYAFSALQYVPSAWRYFIKRVAELNTGFKPYYSSPDFSQQVVFEAWPGWEVPEGYKEVFAQMQTSKNMKYQKEKGGIEPDVVIKGNGWQFIVESEESKDYEAVQLVQQYVMSKGVTEKHGGEIIFQLLVGPTLGRPGKLNEEIKKIWEQYGDILKKCDGNVDHQLKHLYWIGWEEVARIFATEADNLQYPENLILLNALEILKTKNHHPIPSPRDILEKMAGKPELRERIDAWVGELIAKGKFDESALREISSRKELMLSLLSIL